MDNSNYNCIFLLTLKKYNILCHFHSPVFIMRKYVKEIQKIYVYSCLCSLIIRNLAWKKFVQIS